MRSRREEIGTTSWCGCGMILKYPGSRYGVVSECYAAILTIDQQILQTIDESLFANLDVGIGSISWNLVFLACYPDVQVELYNEIISETRNHGWEYYVQQGNTLLEACICESLRLRPIAGMYAFLSHTLSLLTYRRSIRCISKRTNQSYCRRLLHTCWN